MARGGLNYELAATVLIEAAYLGDEKAAERNGVSVRSLQNYRKRLASGDKQLTESFAMKRAVLSQQWGDKLPLAINECVEFIATAAAQSKTDKNTMRNPALIAALAGAMKLCVDAHLTGKVIDARIAATNRPAHELPGQVPAEADGESSAFIN